MKYENYLKEEALKKLKEIDGVEIYNKSCETGIISFNIDGCHPHDTASVFDNDYHVCIRAGHHCAQLITKWLGTVGTVRASFYFYNNMEDVDKFIKSVIEAKNFFSMF